MTKEPIRVLLAEDQQLILHALTTLIGRESDIEVVAGAIDGAEALRFARAHRPDVVLMDLQMPRIDGISATKQILAELPETIIIILTTFCNEEKILEAINAGAHSYLLKDTEPGKVVEVIRAAVRNEPYLSPDVTRLVMDALRTARSSIGKSGIAHANLLTSHEGKILAMIVDGKSNADIAKSLSLAEGTIKNYVSAILEKFDAKNRTELAMKAIGRHRL